MSIQSIMLIYKQLPFLNHILNPNFQINNQFASMVFSALEGFAQNFNDTLNLVRMGDYLLCAQNVSLVNDDSSQYFSILAIAEKDMNPKKVNQSLKDIEEAFFSIYSRDDVLQWDGNILTFLPFKQVLNRIILEDSTGLVLKELQKEFIKKAFEEEDYNETFSLIISDKEGIILDAFSVNSFDPPLKKILNIIKNDITSARSNVWEGIFHLPDEKQGVYIYSIRSNQFSINPESHESDETYIIFCYLLGERYQIFLPKLITKFKRVLAVPIARVLNAQSKITPSSFLT